MKIRETIREIEERFSVQDIEMDGHQVWLMIRNHLITLKKQGVRAPTFGLSGKLKFIFSAFKGWIHWFQTYDVWVISNVNERRVLDGKSINRLFHPLIDRDSTLYIELPLPSHPGSSLEAYSNVSSKASWMLMEQIYTRFFLRKAELRSKEIIDSIQQELGVEVDSRSLAQRMIAQYRVLSFLLNYRRPKKVYLGVSYTNFGYVRALRDAGVEVIELQHGVISKDHYGYNVFADFHPHYFPASLYTFGELEEQVFYPPNKWGPELSVYPTGSYFLQHMTEHGPSQAKVDHFKGQYEVCVSVSLQESRTGDKLALFIRDLAAKESQILFLLCPRHRSELEYRKETEFSENVIFSKDMTVYEAIMRSDVHLTAYSSCALEAPAFGVPNVLVDFDAEASAFFGALLKAPSTVYVNSVEEARRAISRLILLDKEQVKRAHEKIVKTDFLSNLKTNEGS